MALQASIKKITPPGSIINGPPTPPLTDTKPAARVARILRAFRDYQEGAPPRTPWTVYKLSSEEYDGLLDRLQHDELLRGFVADKIRYDYDPIQSKFILRIPTTIHDTFIARLVTKIEKKLESLADTEIEARPFIEGIKPVCGVLNFLIGDEDQQQNIRHEPDIRFQHKDAAWPGVVIEVAHSQTRKSLVDLADNYILGSYGGITVLVGLDLDYKKSKEASISVWRLKNFTNEDGEVEGEVEQVIDNQVTCTLPFGEVSIDMDQLFRDAEGNPVLSSSSSLELSLKDFAIKEVTHGVPDSSIVIDSETLCKLLDEAEKWDNKTITMQGAKPPRFKRKWRLQTSPEQLTFSDEENFVEEERRVRRKSEKLDDSMYCIQSLAGPHGNSTEMATFGKRYQQEQQQNHEGDVLGVALSGLSDKNRGRLQSSDYSRRCPHLQQSASFDPPKKAVSSQSPRKFSKQHGTLRPLRKRNPWTKAEDEILKKMMEDKPVPPPQQKETQLPSKTLEEIKIKIKIWLVCLTVLLVCIR